MGHRYKSKRKGVFNKHQPMGINDKKRIFDKTEQLPKVNTDEKTNKAAVQRTELVQQIASALLMVLEVEPQLLYEAGKATYSRLCTMDVQNLQQSEPNPLLVKRIPLRQAICLVMGKILMSGGEVMLNEEEVRELNKHVMEEELLKKQQGTIN